MKEATNIILSISLSPLSFILSLPLSLSPSPQKCVEVNFHRFIFILHFSGANWNEIGNPLRSLKR